MGLALFGYQQYGYWSIPAPARAAGAALRGGAAYADPREPGVVDLARARQVLGDRPIMVAVLPADYPGSDLDACGDVAKQHSANLAMTYRGAGDPTVCAGSKFPAPQTKSEDTDQWVFSLAIETDYAAQYRVSAESRAHTPEVEELVLAFDAAVRSDYPDGVPVRQTSPDPLVWWRVILELAGLVLLTVAVFAALRYASRKLIAVRATRAALRVRRLELTQELSKAAAEVMAEVPHESTSKARLRADAAEQYVHALSAFEAAGTATELDAAQPQFAALAATIEWLQSGEQSHRRPVVKK
ncbi:MAG: hypothetical protein M3Y19_02135 [Actinomycetota bacterium]|nr:hypothetical protein [Actinomycetota bacterium]